MNTQKIFVGVLAVLVVIFATLYFSKPSQVVQPLTAGSSGSFHSNLEAFLSGIGVGYGNNQSVTPPVINGGRGVAISTTTDFCIINPPTATSTIISIMASITTATSSNPTVLTIGTTTTPYAATTSISSLSTEANVANGTRPITYRGGNSMFITPLDYVVVYYDAGTKNDQLAQQQGGSCGDVLQQNVY